MTAYICKRTQYITDLKHECNLFTIITILRTCKKKNCIEDKVVNTLPTFLSQHCLKLADQ